jgi:pseudouridine-5'-phosphate glycosidase
MIPIHYSDEVKNAITAKKPIIALESTILAHGMPYPDNINFANDAENTAREQGVIPATIAIFDGVMHVGLDSHKVEQLCKGKHIQKVATRDLAWTLAHKMNGATTVSATMKIAHLAGISVFATGGIGGVHRNLNQALDISADLLELSRTPLIVVSAGAKSILDLSNTLELMETLSIPVVGIGTDEFPAFYSRTSGHTLTMSTDKAKMIAHTFKIGQELNIKSGLLVANPVPHEYAIAEDKIETVTRNMVQQAEEQGIHGKALTPWLLKHIVETAGPQLLETNMALAINNIKVGSAIAKHLY